MVRIVQVHTNKREKWKKRDLKHWSVIDSLTKSNLFCKKFTNFKTGYTNLTFVLLLITGEFLDSYIDNNGSVGGMASKGTTVQPDFGLLSNAECTDYQKIGHFFTRPKKNIWIAYYGAHFTVMISTQSGNYELDSLSKYKWVPFTPKHPFTSLINNAVRTPP